MRILFVFVFLLGLVSCGEVKNENKKRKNQTTYKVDEVPAPNQKYNKIDTSYRVNYDNFDCNEAYLYEKYNINVHILTDDQIPSPNHQFYYYNEFDDTKEYSQTNINGISDYLQLKTLKVDNAGLNINFNSYYFVYSKI